MRFENREIPVKFAPGPRYACLEQHAAYGVNRKIQLRSQCAIYYHFAKDSLKMSWVMRSKISSSAELNLEPTN